MKQKMSTFLINIAQVMILIGVLAVCGGVAASSSRNRKSCAYMKPHSRPRAYKVSVTEFGAVGDGLTLNTKTIETAIQHIAAAGADKGGGLLYFPPGQWLTGSFGLISHLTLSFHKDAVLLASMNSEDWPVIDPLPSYGRGRELPGKRHQSLIYGYNLTDVIITGDNATINGQGNIWWDWFRNKTLNYTRPHLIEFISSNELLISDLTLLNSPFWNIHPVYCSKVVVRNLTIIAPYTSPNTDGIDPDSSNDVCIEDCYISNGDDLVAIKSGWDEYGISFARPSTNIHIYRLTGNTQSSGVVMGSEMSGGVSEVYVEDLKVFDTPTGSAIAIRTTPGRGGYVRNVYISNVFTRNVSVAIWFNISFGQHPDKHFNPKALPSVEKITIKDVVGDQIGDAGLLHGYKGDDFRDICLYNVTLNSIRPWDCSYVHGYSGMVSPSVCEPLRDTILPNHYSDCYHFISVKETY